MISPEHVRIIVDAELSAARAWAERHKSPLDWLPDALECRVKFTQPETGEVFFLRGVFDNYRAVAPEWSFVDPEWGQTGHPKYFPKPGQASFGASIFILHDKKAIICVPFNRLAYADHGGPHTDWSGPASWLNAGPTNIQAHTLGDMLQAVHRDFVFSRGRMGDQ